MPKRITPIDYTSRDFSSIKQDLIEYSKRYYSDTFKDFNEASFGSLLLDTVSYVGDILSFYLDYQVNESFLETSNQYDNLVKIGRQLGYKFNPAPTAYGTVALYIIVPSNSTGLGPDADYLPILRKGSSFSSTGGAKFILNGNVNFSDSENEVVVADVDQSTGVPNSYAVRAYGQVISGEFFSEFIEVGEYKKFRKVRLPAGSISEVVSVRDSEGHQYFEVDYLSQNTVFIEVANQGTSRNTVKTILKPVIVPRRFTVEQELGAVFLQFGYGSEENLQDNLIVDPSNIALEVHGKNYVSDTSFDPTRLTKTDKFGVAPANTILTVVYRRNLGGSINASVGSINKVNVRNLIFPSVQEGAVLTSEKQSLVLGSLEVTNQSPVVGSVDLPNSDELKRRIYGNYSAQNRAVTRQDYVSLIYSMPSQLGAIKRVNIVQDADSFKRNLNVYVISEDSNGDLVQANAALKGNVKNWIKRYKMINDTIDILDTFIVNIGIEFTAVASEGINKFDLNRAAISFLSERMTRSKKEIGERFFITEVYSLLDAVPGLLDVVDVKIVKKTGSNYSSTTLFLEELTDPDGRFIDIPENVILEIKFPNADIKGTIL
jgi:hypothetical protein